LGFVLQFIWGGLNLPTNIFYTPFDLATLLKMSGYINPSGNYGGDLNRYVFAGANPNLQHNALEDARVECICWEKILSSK
jgi:hypothetical protein